MDPRQGFHGWDRLWRGNGVGCDQVPGLVAFNGFGGVGLVFFVCGRRRGVRGGVNLVVLGGWGRVLDRQPAYR